MKLTKKKLRKIIKEELLKEAVTWKITFLKGNKKIPFKWINIKGRTAIEAIKNAGVRVKLKTKDIEPWIKSVERL